MRRKILLGFLAIGFLLLFSVLMTMYQLERLTRTGEQMMETISADIELSKRMLDAVQDQNTALLEKIMTGNDLYDPAIAASRAAFDEAFGEVSARIGDVSMLDDIRLAKIRYEEAIDGYVPAGDAEAELDWFMRVYRSNYYDVTSAVKNYMVVRDVRLRNQLEELGGRAYRVITPSVLALIVMLLIIGMFFLFIDLYFVKPVVRINDSLGGYLDNKTPFNVKMEGHDEVYELREKIEELISLYKNKRSE